MELAYAKLSEPVLQLLKQVALLNVLYWVCVNMSVLLRCQYNYMFP